MTKRLLRTGGLLSFEKPARLRKGDLKIEEGRISAIGGVNDVAGAVIAETPYIVVPGFTQGLVHLEESLFDRYFVPTPPRDYYRNVQVPASLKRLTQEEISLSLRTGLDQVHNCGTSGVGYRIRSTAEAHTIVKLVAERNCRAIFFLDLDQCSNDHDDEVASLLKLLNGTRTPDLFHLALFCKMPRPGLLQHIKQARAIATRTKLPLMLEPLSLQSHHTVKYLKDLTNLNSSVSLAPRSLKGIEDVEAMKSLAEFSTTVHVSPLHHLLIDNKHLDMSAAIDADINFALSAYSGATRSAFDIFEEMRIMARWLQECTQDPCTRAFRMATVNASQALGIESGQIGLGQRADLTAVSIEAESTASPETVASKILDAGSEVIQALWVHGEPVSLAKRNHVPSTPHQVRQISQTRSKLKPFRKGSVSISIASVLRARLAHAFENLRSRL